MYELIILSLLMRFPAHGYLIAKIANDIIGPWAKISNGTLYPLLTRLVQTGIIALTDDESDAAQTERPARRFMITDGGRKRFYQLMMDTSSNIGDYQRIFHLKAGCLDLLPSRESLHLLNHYINYSQACILHLKTETESLIHELEDTPQRKLALNVMRHRAELWQAEVDWTMQLREELVSRTESEKSGVE
ncbi:MAG: PadR family transcriptional regulator [Chloroflexi bacterium]|nr:PadR family transcriptional regulator [Chloroflexota bacterium]